MHVLYNNTAPNILASAGVDNLLKIWDLETLKEITAIDIVDNPFLIRWNSEGSLIANIGKDKKLRIIDPRATEN